MNVQLKKKTEYRKQILRIKMPLQVSTEDQANGRSGSQTQKTGLKLVIKKSFLK